MIFQNGCSKDHILFKKKKWKFVFFPKKKEKKKRNLISKKKKKIILFQKSSSLELRLDLILYDRGRQPCKGPVPFTQTTLENKVKTM